MPTTINLRNATIAIGKPIPIRSGHGPGLPEITVDSISLNRDGQPWLPVMGEIHFARVPETHWRRELLKMRAGGIDQISTYIFWIHHEERQGNFDWTGRRSLRNFVQICAELKFPMIVRGGPWCHGEVRNGGLPDWILGTCKTRTDDPIYLDHVKKLYAEIAQQLHGLLWKDGGPVLGLQIENEFGGQAEHLVTLKKLALEAGLDVPLYTRTGWPQTKGTVPFGQLLPLFGAYPEGFWDRELKPMPGAYWRSFAFSARRQSDEIGTDQLGRAKKPSDTETPDYPNLTCELGGGMEQSYHRRVLIDPRDILAIAITRVGSGSNLPGYYMYHGGINPAGKLSTLQESQATKFWNDVPVLSYDFQAPLGQFGQVRPQFHLLRLLHLFLQDFGALLARCDSHVPAEQPQSKTDNTTLRFATRSDGENAFIFISNYQRGAPQLAKENVQFELQLPGDTRQLPSITVPADLSFFIAASWPKVGLKYAMAQPICTVAGTIVFTEIPGITAEFALSDGTILKPSPGLTPFCAKPSMILLDAKSALSAYKVKSQLIVSPNAVAIEDGDSIVLETEELGPLQLSSYPPSRLEPGNSPMDKPAQPTFKVKQPPGELRKIHMGSQKVAEAPVDADFVAAGIWTIDMPDQLNTNSLLRVHYRGDVARLYAGDVFLNDSFFNGRPFDLAMDLLPPGTRSLELRILPLQKSAPIYFSSPPDFAGGDTLLAVDSVELIARMDVRL